ncbi:helix-turn-helix domain-containing protein [Methanomassiliicoccus luminyensis]|uniref:helix-turn-helix domain-containing protein n=2 Tax=Methanomassiliicoccus luminyensis TaxID=1080712 RepID=UPI000674323F|nr:helix-turn-helix domain-containing protein [Methanomassiliicoccus luminyensis]
MPRVSKKQNRMDVDKVTKLLLSHPELEVEAIVQQTGLSNQQVYKILRDLENEGIIFGNTRLLDLSKINRKRFLILAKRSGVIPNPNTVEMALYGKEFMSRLAEEKIDIIPEDDFTCNGEWDMITVIVAENALQANKYVDFLRAVSQDQFSKFSMVEVLFTTKKNTVGTPDIEDFAQYISEVSSYRKKYGLTP